MQCDDNQLIVKRRVKSIEQSQSKTEAHSSVRSEIAPTENEYSKAIQLDKTDHVILEEDRKSCETNLRAIRAHKNRADRTARETDCRTVRGEINRADRSMRETDLGTVRGDMNTADRKAWEADCRVVRGDINSADTTACETDHRILKEDRTACETDCRVVDCEESVETPNELFSCNTSLKCDTSPVMKKSDSGVVKDIPREYSMRLINVDKDSAVNVASVDCGDTGRRTAVNVASVDCGDTGRRTDICKRHCTLTDAPTYCPSDELFEEPVSYIELLQSTVSCYGLGRIVPPPGWMPQCEIADNTRFLTQLQYIHKLRNRCGPNVRRLSCLRTHLKQKGIRLDQLPLVGGVEVDLIAMLDSVNNCGGLNHVISNNQWAAVADMSRTVKCNKIDSTSRLSELYCRYLLSYDTLDELQKTQLKTMEEMNKSTADVDKDCFLRGKYRTVAEFATIAHNVRSAHFKTSPTSEQIEELYWRYVDERHHHVVVQFGQLLTSAFPTQSSTPYSQHGWNFNVLNLTKLCLVRQFCECSDVTRPSLNFAMLFTTKCWSRSVHLLPSLHYLHRGADIIWFCVAASQADQFKQVVRKLVPTIEDIENATVSSRLMINPLELVAHGIKVTRLVQHCGQYVYVSPGSFTASIATGYSISETIHLATPSWLQYGFEATHLFRSLSIPDAFSMSKLLCSIALSCDGDDQLNTSLVEEALPLMKLLFEREFELESCLIRLGLSASATGHDEHIRCDVCKMLCYMSMVVSEYDDVIYCLEHAVEFVKDKQDRNTYKLFYQFTQVNMKLL